ncbi:MAG: bifunctional UDP-N-acetylglucosamine diphosphorylase/glucosamine-1-phosphate N-acetyltransferase GlmU [Pseudomonadota bacterium]
MTNKTAVVIMAAGAGTRFKSKRSKLLHDLAGKPAIKYFSDMMSRVKPDQTIFVLSHQKDEIIKVIGEDKGFDFVEQKVLDGTAGAVRAAVAALKPGITKVVVLPGDTPTIPDKLVKELIFQDATVILVGTQLEEPEGYGRVKKDESDAVTGIIEEADLKGGDKEIKHVNTSIYSFNRKFLEKTLSDISKNKNKNEFYLTDIISLADQQGVEIKYIEHKDPSQVLGANDRLSFSKTALRVWKERAAKHSANGVTIIDAEKVYIDEEVKIGKDSEIYPNVFINGNSEIGEDVLILEGTRINNSKIAKDSVIGPYVVMDGAQIGEENKIGPFTYIRPGTRTNKKVKIGGFVETKKITVGECSKIPHLSYVGDATIGKDVNIGCGVITCNYDGFNKYKTEIGDNVFIGSDSQLIAPVKINSDSYVGAGSTITDEVPQHALAISRVPQKNIKDYVLKIRAKKKKLAK